MINDIGKRLENLLTEINILKDKRKEIDGKIKIKEQELENCCRELLSLQQELTSPHQPRYDVPQILSKYNTPEWRAKRAAIFNRDNYKCQMCGGTATEVHHINYKDENGNKVGNEIWRSPKSYLVSLCATCHKKFNVTYCYDAIFIPANPPRLASSERKCKRTDLELVNPSWDEVSEKLRHINLSYDYRQEKALSLIVLNPESTKTGRELLGLQSKNGINELDKYKIIHRYNGGSDVKFLIRDLEDLQKSFPSVSKNCQFIIKEIKPLIELGKRKPQKGIIHMALHSKKNGYAIGFFDIEKNDFVRIIDMSEIPEYCNTKKKDYNFVSQFYALKYVSDRCKETGENSYDIPIFPNDPNGDLSYIDTETVLSEVKSRIEDKNIYELVNKVIGDIDLSNFYLYEERWHNEFWGEIPTEKYRRTSILKLKKETSLRQYNYW